MKQLQSVLSLLFLISFAILGKSGRAQFETFPYNSYKCFTGNLAAQSVHVYLTSLGGRINGWYALDSKRNNPIPLSFENQKSNDSLLVLTELVEQGKTTDTTRWQCIYNQGKLTGKRTTSGESESVEPILLKEEYPGGTFPFAIKIFNQTYDAFPAKDTTPQWETTYEYPVCTQVNAKAKWINNQIKLLMTGDPNLAFDSIISEQVARNLKEYREQMEGMKNDNYSASMNYESIFQIYIDYNKDNFLVLNSDVYDYSGGAHGNYAELYNCYDVQEEKQLHLEDILTADSLTLQKLIETQYRDDNQLKPEDTMPDIYDNKLPTTENFYLNGMGIGFVYNPYEVAPYVRGIVQVLIPYEKLDKYLKPAFRERMGIKIK